MNPRKPIIGITGGIGSGKSTVARMMGRLGGLVIDADAAARQATDRPDVIARIRDLFGDAVLDPAGRIDRKRLAARVFDAPDAPDAPDARRRLEAIIHPIVARERDRLIAAAQDDPAVRFIVLDVPLLFEVGLDKMCDRVVFVHADRPTRLARLAASRGWDEAELARREKNQISPDSKRKSSHDIIDNSNGEDACLAQVTQLLESLPR